MKDFVKKNVKTLTILAVVILISVVGATLALTLKFDSTDVTATMANVVVNIRYEEDENNQPISAIVSSGDMLPTTIDTSDIDNVLDSDRAVKFKFWVSGAVGNPANSIYDIALNNINIDCELKNTYVKWVLYKNNVLFQSGNLSPSFDLMPNNRMLLTTTQLDLTTTEDEYLFALYMEETCSSSDASACVGEFDHSDMFGKSFSANINIETSTKTKKTNVRTTSNLPACTIEGQNVARPVCAENLTYDGTELLLFTAAVPTGVIVNQSTATAAGTYIVTAKVDSGYKWSDDGTTGEFILTCKMNKRSITISTQNQNSASFVSDPQYVNVTNLATGHTIHSIHLNTIGAEGGDIITAGAAVIYDANDNDVTSNYIINYQSLGKLTG